MAVPEKCPFDSCKAVTRGKKGLRAADGSCRLPKKWTDREGHEHDNHCLWVSAGRLDRHGAKATKDFLGFDENHNPTWKARANPKLGPTRAQRVQAAYKRACEKGMVKPDDRRQAKIAAGSSAPAAVSIDAGRTDDTDAPDETVGAREQ